MTDQPTFEYHDEDGDDLSVRPMRGIPAVLILTGTNGIAVDLDRVEEVIAGIRDAARTAARQTTGHDDTGAAPVGRCTVMLQGGGRCEKRADHRPPGSDDPHTPEPAVVQPDPAVVERFIQHMASQPDPTTADDPTPLRWGHGDVLHGDDDSVIVCLSGPDREPYWLELDAERAAAFRRDLAPPGDCPQCGDTGACNGGPCAHPAVGQPAEAHDTDARARLAELVGYAPDERDPEFEKRVDALIGASLHEAARRMENAGYDDDAVNFLDLLAARQTVEDER